MASITARLPLPPLKLVNGRQSLNGTPQKLAMPSFKEGHDRLNVKSKATGESSENSIVKSVQNVWDKSEDRVALIGLGFAGVVGLWAAIKLISTIDKVPLVPGFLELVGIVYSSWFIYRYLLYKPDREELFQTVNKSISDILGQ
ncbi:hypothetical protein F511_39960 [Dorcoceras hygrometricum]|uniref:Cyanobacterial aminoacyl-tRNA synthetase CAAD domain-containing protein n=1 Tax=Dorcoceras hygrometricum TaxID=472368 RepID=A0A2Z7CSC2_9LAMI|nr:hypothetical protein F511_39960 [Dorcoceras hygrometricum]